jgi:hypothetical protein
MDRVTVAADWEQEVRALIDDFGLDEAEARFILALARGEIDGDVRFLPPLTADERRRFGLGRGPHDDPSDDERPK